MKKYQSFLSENFRFLKVNFSIYLNRRVLVMKWGAAFHAVVQEEQISVSEVTYPDSVR